MADKFFAIDDQTYLFPTPVRNAYLADTQNLLNAQIPPAATTAATTAANTAVANAITSTALDPKIAPLVTGSSSTRTAMDTRYVIQAPPPSGGDDSAVLQALINAAQTSGGAGLIQLAAGTYKCNITMNGGFNQPLLVGRARGYTTLQGVSSSSPVVRIAGGSGSMAGGGVRSLTIASFAAQQGIGLQFADCDGVEVWDVRISGFSIGVNWQNEAGGWTEFDTFQGSIDSCVLPARYTLASGATQESFHGSGIVGNTNIGLMATVGGIANTSWGAIWIDQGCFPYNAPIDATFFMTADNQPLITNNSTPGNRFPNFYGTIRIEMQGLNTTHLGVGSNSIWYQGTISCLGGTTVQLGSIYLADKVHFDNTNVFASLKQLSGVATCNNSPVQVIAFPELQGAHYLISVHLRNGGYDFSYLLIHLSQFGGIGNTVSVLSNTQAYQDSSHQYGAPSFSWGGGLYISNPNFPASTSGDPVKAYVTVTPLGGSIDKDTFPQNIF